MAKKQVLKLDTKITSQGFIDKVKEQFVEKYAADMVKILEDKEKLERALAKINQVITSVEAGDYSAIGKYKKARQLLEVDENAEF